ncbi:MAG: hypothetical protein JL50_00865 [Peptococcaceae bacterium BICA1-7]|nr:MAG: hypothetical protein JL50_00865 [Peptococcaceae bacterium BICA1-7]HBV98059.1 restriction endonuclease [Desulfotomaculum sp.]
MSNMWLVRAGEAGYLIEDFLKEKIVAVGWNEIGDLTKIKSLENIKKLLRKHFPTYKDGKINITASHLNRFKFSFKIGDYIVTYDTDERIYYIGKIISDYEYNDSITEMYHIRRVEWTASLLRDKLSPSSRNTLGSALAIIGIQPEVQKEILKSLNNNNTIEEDIEEVEEELDVIKEDTISKANEFIKDKISGLNWEEMQQLVAGILRGMGYKTKISQKGPDRGRDILASPDGLGLEEPRIIVQVKHRTNERMGVNEVRGFAGLLRSGDKGIFVSTGGFTKEANYEAERSSNPIAFVDADNLVELITQHYDNFDVETKTLIPLKKIYWPV